MTETLDQADRSICAALLRNGRAPWRLIAQATGLQERTVSRRATRLFEQGLVRVTAFAHPLLAGRGDAFLARFSCRPEQMPHVARWLAHRPETLWVSTLMSQSAVLAECFIRPEEQAAFIERELPFRDVTDYSFAPLHHYRRTVRGWQPDILDRGQLAVLGEDETSALNASEGPLDEFDQVDREILDLLIRDGRMSIDAISSELGLAKATVRRRIQLMQHSDRVSIRAVLEPALLGFPHEIFLTARAPLSRLDELAELIAADSRARWVAETTADGSVRAMLACRNSGEVPSAVSDLAARFADDRLTVETERLLTMYKRSDVVLPPAIRSS
ncbi:Lrp/AsnC family transcriptional regulator [Leucobacter tenebrionis]|uniref:Lrp/AsnC family transcriptional regulator n=1 Tax=Leucobacter tenebrionis TaxID=2873270 RepID=UPI001CA6C9F1|nr:Lrp/AsnC family transcriptional regulator [Leucobacter tenebrionis]QZY53210.1 Lrp/AsnC family transcriptional regulator [Leucobacter tenebrionis]